MIYLAAPYRDDNPAIMSRRLEATRDVTERMVRQGLRVFSPLVYSTALRVEPPDTWYHFDLDVLDLCDEMAIFCLPGWQESYGVNLEYEHAVDREIPVSQIFPNLVGDWIKRRRKR